MHPTKCDNLSPPIFYSSTAGNYYNDDGSVHDDDHGEYDSDHEDHDDGVAGPLCADGTLPSSLEYVPAVLL